MSMHKQTSPIVAVQIQENIRLMIPQLDDGQRNTPKTGDL